jgi:inorganic pyrophosphatase/exopolyphosphatase
MVPRAEMLSNNTQMRQQIIIKGHEWVKTKMLLQTNIPYRQWLYEAVWQRKQLVDKITNKRIQDINVSIKKF